MNLEFETHFLKRVSNVFQKATNQQDLMAVCLSKSKVVFLSQTS